MSKYTPKLKIKLIDEKEYFADDAFNAVIKDADDKLVGISHLSSAMHWDEWTSKKAYNKNDIIKMDNFFKAKVGNKGQLARLFESELNVRQLEYITEKTATNLVDKIVQFFENIISNMRDFAKTISDTVNAKIRTAEMKKNLRQLHVKAEQLKASGKRTINIPDFDQIERVLTENIRKLRKVSSRIVKNQYKTTVAMDDDFKDFLRLHRYIKIKSIQFTCLTQSL